MPDFCGTTSTPRVTSIVGAPRIATPAGPDNWTPWLLTPRGRGGHEPLRHPAGQRRCLPDPTRHEFLVDLVVLMDVDVPHVLVFGLPWRKRTQ